MGGGRSRRPRASLRNQQRVSIDVNRGKSTASTHHQQPSWNKDMHIDGRANSDQIEDARGTREIAAARSSRCSLAPPPNSSSSALSSSLLATSVASPRGAARVQNGPGGGPKWASTRILLLRGPAQDSFLPARIRRGQGVSRSRTNARRLDHPSDLFRRERCISSRAVYGIAAQGGPQRIR